MPSSSASCAAVMPSTSRRTRPEEDGGSVCHALILGLARSGDAIDEQADEARLPHLGDLARKGAQRGGVFSGGSKVAVGGGEQQKGTRSPGPFPKGSRFEPGSNGFAVLGPYPNPELDFRSGSGWWVNLEPDFSPVRKSSGSNLGSEPDCGITRRVDRPRVSLIELLYHAVYEGGLG